LSLIFVRSFIGIHCVIVCLTGHTGGNGFPRRATAKRGKVEQNSELTARSDAHIWNGRKTCM